MSNTREKRGRSYVGALSARGKTTLTTRELLGRKKGLASDLAPHTEKQELASPQKHY
jgi:hypothetical protein